LVTSNTHNYLSLRWHCSSFGSRLAGDVFASTYRYGYQGSEREPQVLSNDAYSTDYRILDTRIGRWFSTDPITHPWPSPYTSMDNNPIALNDVYGLSTGNEDNNPMTGQPFDPCEGEEDPGPEGNDEKRGKVGDAIMNVLNLIGNLSGELHRTRGKLMLDMSKKLIASDVESKITRLDNYYGVDERKRDINVLPKTPKHLEKVTFEYPSSPEQNVITYTYNADLMVWEFVNEFHGKTPLKVPDGKDSKYTQYSLNGIISPDDKSGVTGKRPDAFTVPWSWGMPYTKSDILAPDPFGVSFHSPSVRFINSQRPRSVVFYTCIGVTSADVLNILTKYGINTVGITIVQSPSSITAPDPWSAWTSPLDGLQILFKR
jgi:RHS repeat-associated protein